jgi:hypothetical protein
MALFPGTARYPAGTTFTLHVLLQAEKGGGVYQLRGPSGQDIGRPLATTSSDPLVMSTTLPREQLPSDISYLEERVSALGGSVTVWSAFILVEW